jgi:hypothetical protein
LSIGVVAVPENYAAPSEAEAMPRAGISLSIEHVGRIANPSYNNLLTKVGTHS